MTLDIYRCYSESRKSWNHLKQNNLPKDIMEVEAHKANIVMDKLLEYLRLFWDCDENTCVMEGKTLLDFSRWIQSQLNEKKI